MRAFEGTSKSIVALGFRLVTTLLHEVLGMLPELPNTVDPDSRSHRTKFRQINYWKKNPNVIVSKDGTGKFQQIMQAVEAAPNHSRERFVILVKRGVYREYVNITAEKTNLVLVGEGMGVTTITGHKSNGTGWSTFGSPTFGHKRRELLSYIGL